MNTQAAPSADARGADTAESDVYIALDKASFAWNRDTIRPTVNEVTVRVQAPELLAIVGSIGSGKSSLVAGMTKQIQQLSGRVEAKGRTAYCSQQPWLFNATLRDNILFGQPFDEQRYNEVIRVCALQRDLEILPNGIVSFCAEMREKV